jgi:thiol-disulfide isomerase/thioredoxin
MLNPEFLRGKFQAGYPYDLYVQTGRPDQQESWKRQHDRVQTKPDQLSLIGAFQRELNVLVTSGLWCGDCAAQVPMLDHISRASRLIQLRILDRDTHLDVAEQVRICGGLRVPTVLFLNEDFDFLFIGGDKSLSRMRARARSLGAFCALPNATVDSDESAATLADWVQAFEYAHLVARLSPKLRERHGD